MSYRVPIAAVVGVCGFVAYVALAVVAADRVLTAHWAVQGAFFLVAGSAWVMPARWLMYWGAGQR